MRLRNFALYKLPIDNTYENVFDGWATKEMNGDNYEAFVAYYNYLNNLYPNYTYSYHLFAEILNKSVKISNGISTITLPISYEVAKDYNYILVSFTVGNATKANAFFITSVTSENDSTENPSCTVTIEYDVWANNYPILILTDNYNPNAYITEGHIHRFEENVKSNTLTFRTIDSVTPRSDCPYKDSVNNFTPYLLWAVYEWNTDYVTPVAQADVLPKDFKPPEQIGNLPSYGTFVYTFAPWRWVKPNGEQSANFTIKDQNDNVLFTSSTDEIVKTQGSSGSAAKFLYNVYLTYYPPFFDKITYVIGEDKTCVLETSNSLYKYTGLSVPDGLTGTTTITGGGYTGMVCLNASQLKNACSVFADVGNYNKVSYNSVIDDSYINEIPYKNYPYSYRYYDFQGKRLNVVNGMTFPLHTLTASPTVWGVNFIFKTSNKYGNVNIEALPIQQIGGVPFSIDRLEQYQRDNSFNIGARLLFGGGVSFPSETVFNKENTKTHKYYSGGRKMMYKTVDIDRTVGSSFHNPSTTGMLYDFSTNALTVGAELLSLANQPNEVKNASSYSQLMFYTLDRPIIHDVNYIKETEIFKNDYNLTLSNGYIFTRYDNIFNNYRVLFDYIKCENFNPFIISNFNEREAITKILYNGVRKWHINNFVNSFYTVEQQGLIKMLDTRVINPEPFLIS